MRHIIWAISYGILYKIHKPNVTALQGTHNTGISLKDCFISITLFNQTRPSSKNCFTHFFHWSYAFFMRNIKFIFLRHTTNIQWMKLY